LTVLTKQERQARLDGVKAYEDQLVMTRNIKGKALEDMLDEHRKMVGLEYGLSRKMREWISVQSGEFSNRDIISELDISKEKKAQVSTNLARFEKDGLIVKKKHGHGIWRRIEDTRQKINFKSSANKSVNIILPFDIHNLADIKPNDLIIIAGAPNAGKSAFIFNIIADNMDRFNIEYYSSEMFEDELSLRLKKFDDIPWPDGWNFEAYEIEGDHFADPIRGGEGNIYIIDYLEMYDEFYKVGGYLSEIHEKLNGGIGIIALQKDPGKKTGLGAYRSLEKPRLYLSMDNGKIEIVKAKNWKGEKNPNGLQIHFKLVQGCKFVKQDEWSVLEP